jgi:hypothetical protein
MLVSSFNLLQSVNYTISLTKKTVKIRDPFLLYIDPEKETICVNQRILIFT